MYKVSQQNWQYFIIISHALHLYSHSSQYKVSRFQSSRYKVLEKMI